VNRLWLALLAPMLLVGCILSPGKFISTMTINADRTFAFTYKGEVIAVDPANALKGIPDKPSSEDSAPPVTDDSKPEAKPAVYRTAAVNPKAGSAPEAEPAEDSEAKNREIAAALSKERGYRSAVYVGKGKFVIDYAITGTLTHNFQYPFNSDAGAILPFVAIELRQGTTVRVKAPGYTNAETGSNPMGGGSMTQAAKLLDGTFTLDTDAEIVSQNNEDGAKIVNGRKVITWRATPLTKDAPTAVLQLKN
jgi:hypothetical protein